MPRGKAMPAAAEMDGVDRLNRSAARLRAFGAEALARQPEFVARLLIESYEAHAAVYLALTRLEARNEALEREVRLLRST